MKDNLTPRAIWEYAKLHHIEDAPIRICDGMAVSYMPDRGCLGRSPMIAVVDVSTIEPIDYDDLPDVDRRVIFD